jgi:hypothetical protein
MANYYWSNIQHWVEHLLEERIDSYDTDELHDFMTHILYSPRTINDYVCDVMEDIEQITNKELLSAILNTVDWNQVKHYVDEYIHDNELLNNV